MGGDHGSGRASTLAPGDVMASGTASLGAGSSSSPVGGIDGEPLDLRLISYGIDRRIFFLKGKADGPGLSVDSAGIFAN